jgi:hypothetical protein
MVICLFINPTKGLLVLSIFSMNQLFLSLVFVFHSAFCAIEFCSYVNYFILPFALCLFYTSLSSFYDSSEARKIDKET